MARYSTPPPQGPLIIAALLVGGSILAGSYLVHNALRDTSSKLQAINSSLTETRDELKTIAANQPASANTKQRGPDPNKRYTINTTGAPAKGPLTAEVELVEFSDFQ
jgi:hypothetical protein